MFNSHAFPLSMARAMYKYIHFQPIITSGFPGGGEKTTSLSKYGTSGRHELQFVTLWLWASIPRLSAPVHILVFIIPMKISFKIVNM